MQAHPLKGIQVGRGACVPGTEGISRESCGGPERGRCTSGQVCECFDKWTGPHCLSQNGFDPIQYDLPDKITDIGFEPPAVAPLALIVGLGFLGATLVVTIQCRERFDRYRPIPEGNKDMDHR